MLHLAPSVSLLNPPVNYFFLIAAVSLFRSVFSQAQCYFPDGSVELLKTSGSPEGYVPCYPSANVSVCCPQGSKCLSNAVCMSEYDSNYEIIGGLYRASCTDRSWNSSQCPGFCRGMIVSFSLIVNIGVPQYAIIMFIRMRVRSILVRFHSWSVSCKKIPLL